MITRHGGYHQKETAVPPGLHSTKRYHRMLAGEELARARAEGEVTLTVALRRLPERPAAQEEGGTSAQFRFGVGMYLLSKEGS